MFAFYCFLLSVIFYLATTVLCGFIQFRNSPISAWIVFGFCLPLAYFGIGRGECAKEERGHEEGTCLFA